jgi:hypothetical protein
VTIIAPSTGLQAPYQPTDLELACGILFTLDEDSEPLPRRSRFASARQALEAAMIAALTRPPCAVSFSGGRDSSGILAVATHVARREGLPLPIPVTLRFPRCEESDEREWQEQVIAHLAIDDWQIVELHDEIDVLGPYAQRVLRRHGLIWPFNAHFHAPIADQVPGGSVLTGFGGDELLSTWPGRRVAMLVSRQTRPRVRDIVPVAKALAPLPVRRRLRTQEYRESHPLPWLLPEAREELARARGSVIATEPIRWDESVREYWWRSRYRQVVCDTKRRVVSDANGAQSFDPLCDAEFLTAIAEERSQLGFRNRTQAMDFLFGDLLPPAVISRATKGLFNSAVWEHYGREFVARWDGTGVDRSIVDIEALREVWSLEMPDPRSFTLLQRAWLAQCGSSTTQSVEQPPDRLVE